MNKIDFDNERGKLLATIDQCSVCFLQYDSEIENKQVAVFLCGHSFCNGCIKQQRIEFQENCPNCRQLSNAFTTVIPLYNTLQLPIVHQLEELHRQQVVNLEQKLRNMEASLQNHEKHPDVQSVTADNFLFLEQRYCFSVEGQNIDVTACNIAKQNERMRNYVALGRSAGECIRHKHGIQLIDIKGFEEKEQEPGPYLEIHSERVTDIVFDSGVCGDIISCSIDGTAAVIDHRMPKVAITAKTNVPIWSVACNRKNEYEFHVGTCRGSFVSFDRRFLGVSSNQTSNETLPISRYESDYYQSGIIEIIPYPLETKDLSTYSSAFIVASRDHGVDIIFRSDSDENNYRCNLLKNPNLLTPHAKNITEHFSAASFDETSKILMSATGCPKYENFRPILNTTNNLSWEFNQVQRHVVAKTDHSLETVYSVKSFANVSTPMHLSSFRDSTKIRPLMDTLHPGCLLRNPHQHDSVLGLLTSYNGDIKLIDSTTGRELAHRNESNQIPLNGATINGCYAYSSAVEGMGAFVVAQSIRGFRVYEIKQTHDNTQCKFDPEEDELESFDYNAYQQENKYNMI
jgi:Ring finger domain